VGLHQGLSSRAIARGSIAHSAVAQTLLPSWWLASRCRHLRLPAGTPPAVEGDAGVRTGPGCARAQPASPRSVRRDVRPYPGTGASSYCLRSGLTRALRSRPVTATIRYRAWITDTPGMERDTPSTGSGHAERGERTGRVGGGYAGRGGGRSGDSVQPQSGWGPSMQVRVLLTRGPGGPARGTGVHGLLFRTA